MLESQLHLTALISSPLHGLISINASMATSPWPDDVNTASIYNYYVSLTARNQERGGNILVHQATLEAIQMRSLDAFMFPHWLPLG